MKNLTNACDIIRDNFPVFFEDNMLTILGVCMENDGWCNRLVDKNDDDLLFLADVSHDIRGMSHGMLGLDPFAEHFLPRI